MAVPGHGRPAVRQPLELQQKSKQVRNLWTRLRHVEEALYIEPSDAFKERQEDE